MTAIRPILAPANLGLKIAFLVNHAFMSHTLNTRSSLLYDAVMSMNLPTYLLLEVLLRFEIQSVVPHIH